jgi:CheY-like chemotaxis protein
MPCLNLPELNNTTSMQKNLTGMERLYKIALIDDDPICHLITSKMIQAFSSARVEAFINPVEALSQLKWRAINDPHEFPDFILLDINMPVMDGWEFLDEFNKLPEPILQRSCVMMLSSSNHVDDVVKAKEYAVVKNFFSKPLTEEMVRAITLSCN